jgi:hypothetical protein
MAIADVKQADQQHDRSEPRPAGSARWSALWGVGMLLVFVGERMIGSGGSRSLATILGLLLTLGALLARVLRSRSTAPDRRRVELYLTRLYCLGLLAVAIYFVQSDLPTMRGGKALEHGWPYLATALGALWPAVWVAAAFPIALIEMALAQMAKAPRLEVGRVTDAMLSGFGTAFALVFAFSLAYMASERDPKLDLAYFRTTRPGEVTRKIVRNLDKPVEIAAFFPSGNDVLAEVDDYLKDLARESGQLKITHYDYDINPVKAKEYGVSANGILVFVRGGRHEQLGLQTNIEQARTALRTLDKEVQQRFMMIVKPTRTVLITQGHGERNWEAPANDTDKRSGIKTLRDMLIDQSYDVRYVSATDGLGQDVPKDATVVMVLGPQKPFLPEEMAALNRYIDRGGRVLMALDPENKVDMHEVLEPLMLEYKPVTLASDLAFVPHTHQDSDHGNLVTATYTSHPSVTTLQRLGGRAPIVLPGAGWINTRRDRPKDVVVDSPIKAHFSTYEDKNGNFHQDPDENKRAWEIGATAVKKDGRVFVLADSDSLSDEVIRVAANQLMALDITHWLMGDEAYQGVTSSEADVPISHTRKQDVIWFYSTIFLAPALLVGLGFGVTRGARRKRKQGKAAADAAAPPAAGAQS